MRGGRSFKNRRPIGEIGCCESRMAELIVCFVHFDLETCFAPQQRATFHLSSDHMAPHPPLSRAYFSTLRSHKSLEQHSVLRLSYLFAHLDLLSSETFSFLIFFLLLFSSLLFSDSSHLCFSFVHIVGSLTSKLPSMINGLVYADVSGYMVPIPEL